MNLVYLDKLGLALTDVFFFSSVLKECFLILWCKILLKYGEENAKFSGFRDAKFLIKLTT